MEKISPTSKNLGAFQSCALSLEQQNATTGSMFSFTFDDQGWITKVMFQNRVIYECCGNGNGVW